VRTQINGQPAPWTPEIYALWEEYMAGVHDERPVVEANHFTPRPYVDEYNRGSDEIGFTYVRGSQVYQVKRKV
jgi:hypothetical protein